jgi:ParB family chromosome partitioning protein
MDTEELREVEITQIAVNPFQPRRHFNQEELQELAASIQAVGMIHPPVVRPLGNQHYELVSGERRFRAAQLAGLMRLPVLIKPHSDALSAQAALIENIQRVDLNPIEIARALHVLANQLQLRQEELAQQVGKKRSTVANYLRLLTLPQEIQESVLSGKITMGHAKAILSLEEAEEQHVLHEKILKEGLSVRQAEQTGQRLSQKEKRAPAVAAQDPHLTALTEKLQQRLGTKVAIRGEGVCGSIEIAYYSLDDLDRLLDFFGIKENIC